MKHCQTVDPLQKESQVGRGLFGIRVLILHFKFQFSKSVKSSTFHIFLNLTYPLRKNLSFPKHLKITQKFTQNFQIVENVISIGIWRRLKRDRDIGRKAVLSDVKTAFTFTPALMRYYSPSQCLLVVPPQALSVCFKQTSGRPIYRSIIYLLLTIKWPISTPLLGWWRVWKCHKSPQAVFLCLAPALFIHTTLIHLCSRIRIRLTPRKNTGFRRLV